MKSPWQQEGEEQQDGRRVGKQGQHLRVWSNEPTKGVEDERKVHRQASPAPCPAHSVQLTLSLVLEEEVA